MSVASVSKLIASNRMLLANISMLAGVERHLDRD
jgi:hypothetical protein